MIKKGYICICKCTSLQMPKSYKQWEEPQPSKISIKGFLLPFPLSFSFFRRKTTVHAIKLGGMRVIYTVTSLKIFNPITWIQVYNVQKEIPKLCARNGKGESERRTSSTTVISRPSLCDPLPHSLLQRQPINTWVLSVNVICCANHETQSDPKQWSTSQKITKAEGAISSTADSWHVSKPFIIHVLTAKGSAGSPADPTCLGAPRQSCTPTERRDAQPGLAALQCTSKQEREHREAKLFKDTQVLCTFRQAACVKQNVSVLTLTYKCYCHTNYFHENIQQQSSKFHPHKMSREEPFLHASYFPFLCGRLWTVAVSTKQHPSLARIPANLLTADQLVRASPYGDHHRTPSVSWDSLSNSRFHFSSLKS